MILRTVHEAFLRGMDAIFFYSKNAWYTNTNLVQSLQKDNLAQRENLRKLSFKCLLQYNLKYNSI
jgi:hypothetical protein